MIKGPIAQLVEPPAHNRKVPGSNPGGPIEKKEGDLHELPGDKHPACRTEKECTLGCTLSVYPVRKPRCWPRVKLRFYRSEQRGWVFLFQRTRDLMPRKGLPVRKSSTF